MNKKVFFLLTAFLSAGIFFAQTKECEYKFVAIPGAQIKMGKTEVTQDLYLYVMGQNPSEFEGNKLPVENISWYDAIVFCNRLSVLEGLTPVYSFNGTTNTAEWGYAPHTGDAVDGIIIQLATSDGYRLPSNDEWHLAAMAGKNFTYSGSKNADEVAWSVENSNRKTHTVASKKANAYGLYDMSGNVWEWTWTNSNGYAFYQGGSWSSSSLYCSVGDEKVTGAQAYKKYNNLGFRICAYDGSKTAAKKKSKSKSSKNLKSEDKKKEEASSEQAEAKTVEEKNVSSARSLDSFDFDVSVMMKLSGSVFDYDESGWGLVKLNDWSPEDKNNYFYHLTTTIDEYGGVEIWSWEKMVAPSKYRVWISPVGFLKFSFGCLDEQSIAFPHFGDWQPTVLAEGYGYGLDLTFSFLKLTFAMEGGKGAYWMDLSNTGLNVVGKSWVDVQFNYDIGSFQFFAGKNVSVGAHGFDASALSDLAFGLAVNFMPYNQTGVYFDTAVTFDEDSGSLKFQRLDGQVGGQFFMDAWAFKLNTLYQYKTDFIVGGEMNLSYAIDEHLAPYIYLDAYNVLTVDPSIDVKLGVTATYGPAQIDFAIDLPVDFMDYKFKIYLPVTATIVL